MDPETLMGHALRAAVQGIEAGQSPFGCAIACDGVVIADAHNTVVQDSDATAHAEINAIRAACRARGTHLLEGALVATTCEPCPMCMAALHWARVETVHFGATISDAASAGFREVQLAASDLVRLGGSPVLLKPGCRVEECRHLFREWSARPDRRAY